MDRKFLFSVVKTHLLSEGEKRLSNFQSQQNEQKKKKYTYLETKDETKITQNNEPKIKKWKNKTSENDST